MKPEEILYNNEYTGKQEPFNNNDISRYLKTITLQNNYYETEGVFKAVLLNGSFAAKSSIMVQKTRGIGVKLSQPDFKNIIVLSLVKMTPTRIIINCNLALNPQKKLCLATLMFSNEEKMVNGISYKGIVTINNVYNVGADFAKLDPNQPDFGALVELLESRQVILLGMDAVGKTAMSFGAYAFYALDGQWDDLTKEGKNIKTNEELFQEVKRLRQQVKKLEEQLARQEVHFVSKSKNMRQEYNRLAGENASLKAMIKKLSKRNK